MKERNKAFLAAMMAVNEGLMSADDAVALMKEVGEPAAVSESKDQDAPAAESPAVSIVSASLSGDAPHFESRVEALAANPEELRKTLTSFGVDESTCDSLLEFGSDCDNTTIQRTLHSITPSAPVHKIQRKKTVSLEDQSRYQIRREQGRGGMGVVHLAMDTSLGREVAIKRLLPTKSGAGRISPFTPATNPDALAERFLREAKVTGQLEHPNIVPVYEIGERDDGSIYYTMKFIRGQSLSDRLASIANDSSLNPDERFRERIELLDTFVQVCNALAFAHSKGVVHRDLKPDNVMLGDFGETLVVDWGLAHVEGERDSLAIEKQAVPEHGGIIEPRAPEDEDESATNSRRLTVAGAVIGTPAYMSPEQARGELDKVDQRSDVYSLGAILFEIISGEPPIGGDSLDELIGNAATGSRKDIRELCPQAPPELVAVIEKALTPEREERLASAKALANEVRAWRDGGRLSVYRYSSFELFLRFVKRNAAAVSVASIALLVLIGLGIWAYWSISQEADRANQNATTAEANAKKAMENEDKARAAAAEAEKNFHIAEQNAKEATANAEEAKRERDAAIKARESEKAALQEAQRNLASAHIERANPLAEKHRYTSSMMHIAAAKRVNPDYDNRELIAKHGLKARAPEWSIAPPSMLTSGLVVLSPSGSLLLTTLDKDMIVWEVASGVEIQRIPFPEYAPSIAKFSPDETLIATGNYDGEVKLWDLQSGELRHVLSLEAENVREMVFDRESNSLIAAADNGAADNEKVIVWDLRSGKELRVLKDLVTEFSDMALAPDGKSIFFVCEGPSPKLQEFELEKGELIREYQDCGKSVGLISLSADGSTLGCTSWDTSRYKVWRRGRSALEQEFDLGHNYVSDAELSPSGSHLLVPGYEGTLEVWDIVSGKLEKTHRTSRGYSVGLEFAKEADVVLMGYADQPVQFLNWKSGESLRDFGNSLIQPIQLEVAPDGSGFITAQGSGRIDLWDMATAKHLRTLGTYQGELLQFKEHPSGEWIFACGKGSGIQRMPLRDSEEAQEAIEAEFDSVQSLAISPDGRFLAYTHNTLESNNAILVLYDLEESKRLKTWETNQYIVNDMSFTPDCRGIYSAGGSQQINLWNCATGGLERQYQGEFYSASFVIPNAAGNYVIAGGSNQSVHMWDVARPDLRYRYDGELESLRSAVFDPDGLSIAGGGSSQDPGVRVWSFSDVAEKHRLEGISGQVISVRYTPYGRSILALTSRGQVRKWSLDHADALRSYYNPGGIQALGFAAGEGAEDIIVLSSNQQIARWSKHAYQQEVLRVGKESWVSASAISSDASVIVVVENSTTLRRIDLLYGADDLALPLVREPADPQKAEGAGDEGDSASETSEGSEEEIPEPTHYFTHSVALLPGGNRVILVTDESALQEWDFASKSMLGEFEVEERRSEDVYYGWYSYLRVSDNGSILAAYNDLGFLRLWDLSTRKIKATIPIKGSSAQVVTFSPDCSLALVSTYDGDLWIHDLKTSQKRFDIAGHEKTYGVSVAAFAPDGKSVVTCGSDGVLIHTSCIDGREIQKLENTEGGNSHLVFNQEGTRLLSADYNGRIVVWDLEGSARQWTALTQRTDALLGLMQQKLGQRIKDLRTVPFDDYQRAAWKDTSVLHRLGSSQDKDPALAGWLSKRIEAAKTLKEQHGLPSMSEEDRTLVSNYLNASQAQREKHRTQLKGVFDAMLGGSGDASPSKAFTALYDKRYAEHQLWVEHLRNPPKLPDNEGENSSGEGESDAGAPEKEDESDAGSSGSSGAQPEEESGR